MVFPVHTITQSSQETQDVGEQLGTFLRERKGASPIVVCLYGQLGSGKTTFTQGVARGLGINGRLPSPTFIIVRRYNITNTNFHFYHYDLYRLRETKDVLALGFEENLDEPGAIIVIEWPEVLGASMPKNRIECTFVTGTDDTHEVTIQNI